MDCNTCEYCGEEFWAYKKQGRVRKYCSRECYLKSVERDKCKCQYCGKRFMPKRYNRTTYCSRKCAFEAKRAPSRGIGIVTVYVCPICGTHVDRFNGYCSDECRRENNRRWYRENYFVSVSETNEFVEKKCEFCGEVFRTNYYAVHQKYCPDKNCAKKAARKANNYRGKSLNSRARHYFKRLYGFVPPLMYESIKRINVLKRDGYVCQLCGLPIDREAKSPHPHSPSIDHVISLGAGGSHTYENVHAAHFICNSIKGANEQKT